MSAAPAQPARPGPRPLTGLQFLLPLVAFVGLLVVPAWLFVRPVLAARDVDLSVPVLGFAVLVGYCALRLTQLMWEAEPRWMVFGFWIFTYAWIAVAGLTQTLADANPLRLTLAPELTVTQVGILLLGVACFDLASRLRPGHRGGRWAAVGTVIARPWRGRAVDPRATMVLAGVSLALSPLIIAALGGPAALLSSREAVADTLTDSGLYASGNHAGGGIVAIAGSSVPFVALICLLRLMVDDEGLRRRPLPRVFLLGLVVVNVIMNNPISNARYWAFAVVLALLFTWRSMARPAVISVFVTAFAVSALVVFPYLDGFRYTQDSIRKYNLQGNSYSNAVDYVLNKTDYGAVTDVAIAVRVTEHQGFSWGRQILGVATFWVPRAIWSDKPDNTAFLIADEIGFPNRNLDSPLWAEGWVDFGWPGTALYLGGLGLLARRLDDAAVALRGVRSRVVPLALVAVPVVAAYEYILLRGSLLQATGRLAVMVGLLLLVSRAVPSSPAPTTPAPITPAHPSGRTTRHAPPAPTPPSARRARRPVRVG